MLQFLLASVVLTVSPGPDILFVLTTALKKGKRTALYLAFGLCSGLIVHTSLVGFGLAQLINQTDWMLWLVKIFGASYVFYMVYLLVKSSAEINITEDNPNKSSLHNYYIKGFLMNVLNPKVSLIFLAFLPQFINYDEGEIFFQAARLGLLFFVQALFIFSSVAFFASKLQKQIQGNLMIGNILHYAQIALFITLGISILFV